MGLSVGGKTARGLRQQAARISACTLKFFGTMTGEGWTRGAIVTSGLRFKILKRTSERFWEDRVVLDETFYAALRDHPGLLLEASIELRDRSMSLDIYVWLAWRCHQLGKPTPISWPAIHAQFGAGFKAIKHFKPSFVEALSAATAAYPDARVEVADSRDHAPPGPTTSRAAGRLTPPASIRNARRTGYRSLQAIFIDRHTRNIPPTIWSVAGACPGLIAAATSICDSRVPKIRDCDARRALAATEVNHAPDCILADNMNLAVFVQQCGCGGIDFRRLGVQHNRCNVNPGLIAFRRLGHLFHPPNDPTRDHGPGSSGGGRRLRLPEQRRQGRRGSSG